MTTMIAEVYDALRAAGAPEDQAHAAATALTEYQERYDHLETKFKIQKWINIALAVAMTILYFEQFMVVY